MHAPTRAALCVGGGRTLSLGRVRTPCSVTTRMAIMRTACSACSPRRSAGVGNGGGVPSPSGCTLHAPHPMQSGSRPTCVLRLNRHVVLEGLLGELPADGVTTHGRGSIHLSWSRARKRLNLSLSAVQLVTLRKEGGALPVMQATGGAGPPTLHTLRLHHQATHHTMHA